MLCPRAFEQQLARLCLPSLTASQARSARGGEFNEVAESASSRPAGGEFGFPFLQESDIVPFDLKQPPQAGFGIACRAWNPARTAVSGNLILLNQDDLRVLGAVVFLRALAQ